MITEDCDKYIKKAKVGFFILLADLLLTLVAKSGYITDELIKEYTPFILFIFVISFVLITILINPYMVCLSKYKK